jgi:two-component system, OmpR family, response regulator
MARILLVEDDPRIADFVRRGLEAEGHVVDWSASADEGFARARGGGYALAVLDRMLPGMDGLDLCRLLRREGAEIRILMLTARDALGDKVGGLRAGADDYITKPFSFDEFVARVEALLRRGDLARPDPVLRVGDLVLDPGRRLVTRGDRRIDLTPKEYGLLRHLMENEGVVQTRAQILSGVWGLGFDPGTKVVDVYVRYLRRKIDEGEWTALIHTARGTGYWIGEAGEVDAPTAEGGA